MKRNFDLIRRILRDVENAPPGEVVEDITYPGEYEQEEIYAHIDLLFDAELLKGDINKASEIGSAGEDILGFAIIGLSWKGHDFLNAARDDTLWAKAKSTVLKPTASATFDILLEWLKVQTKTKLGLP